ncbi:MAG: helix-turn-helix transcriptional regulator [Planctomycetota bacterium]
MNDYRNLTKPHRGRVFKDLRRRKGLSLQALGAAIGVDPSTISRWEARKEFVQFARFAMALHRLGTTPEAFLQLHSPDDLVKLPYDEQAEQEAAANPQQRTYEPQNRIANPRMRNW